MRILVTGGLGTVGTGLVGELRRRGHTVISCDLRHQPDEIGFSVRADLASPSYVRCDVSEFRQLARVFDCAGPFDLVYHTAAEFGRWNGEDFYEDLWRTNAIGTKHILRLQERHRFRLVHLSSSEVYGDWPSLMTETITDDYEIKQLNEYALSKWVNEIQLYNARRQYGGESVIVRLFNTYGPGEYYAPYRSVNCRFLYCALHGLPLVVHRGHSRTSTYLPDAIATLSNIADYFIPGETYNIGGSQLHTIEELAAIAIAVTEGDPSSITYRDAEPSTTRDKRVDVSKAVRHLSHRDTVSLSEGMRLTAEWMAATYRPTRDPRRAPTST